MISNMFQWKQLRAAAFVVAGLVLVAGLASAQTAPYLGAGTTEVNGFAGVSYGLDSWRSSFGGNVGHWATSWLMPYGEFSYFPGLVRDIRVPIGGSNEFATGKQPLQFSDFHGGVHLRKAVSNNIVPYAVFGAGAIRAFKRTVDLNVPIGGGQSRVRPVEVPATNDFAVNGGFGLRIYTKENFGFRAEWKVYKPTGTYTDPFYKFVFGIFAYIK